MQVGGIPSALPASKDPPTSAAASHTLPSQVRPDKPALNPVCVHLFCNQKQAARIHYGVPMARTSLNHAKRLMWMLPVPLMKVLLTHMDGKDEMQ